MKNLFYKVLITCTYTHITLHSIYVKLELKFSIQSPPQKKTKEKEQVGKLYPVLTVNAIC